MTVALDFVNGIAGFFRTSVSSTNLFSRQTFMALAPRAAFAYNRSVRDFLFIDAVSGKPLRREEKGFVPRAEKRVQRSTLQAILIALIGVIISLVLWGFS